MLTFLGRIAGAPDARPGRRAGKHRAQRHGARRWHRGPPFVVGPARDAARRPGLLAAFAGAFATPAGARAGGTVPVVAKPPAWIREQDWQDLRQSTEEFNLALSDMAALQERIKLLQEEIDGRVAEQNNRNWRDATGWTPLTADQGCLTMTGCTRNNCSDVGSTVTLTQCSEGLPKVCSRVRLGSSRVGL